MRPCCGCMRDWRVGVGWWRFGIARSISDATRSKSSDDAEALGYDDLKDLPLPEQVTGQYLSLIEKMEKDLAELPADRVLRISYEHFCSNPEALIEQIRTRLGTIDYRNGAVESFTVAKNVPDTDEELELVRKLEGGRRHTLP